MAGVTVFIDDAVRGWLPRVCAKDGVPTGDSLRITEEIGRSNRLGILWLLLFVGPLGWLVLFVLASRGSGAELLTVEVPLSEPAYQRIVAARRLRNGGVLLGVGGGLGLLALSAAAQLGAAGLVLTVATVAAGVVVAAIGDWRAAAASVTVRLDASRRWVTLGGVHPTFVDACERQVDGAARR